MVLLAWSSNQLFTIQKSGYSFNTLHCQLHMVKHETGALNAINFHNVVQRAVSLREPDLYGQISTICIKFSSNTAFGSGYCLTLMHQICWCSMCTFFGLHFNILLSLFDITWNHPLWPLQLEKNCFISPYHYDRRHSFPVQSQKYIQMLTGPQNCLIKFHSLI